MSYTITAAQLFDSAETSVRHASVAADIVAKLSYDDLDDHASKLEQCSKLLRCLQDEADRRAPAADTAGLVGKLSAAKAADHKAAVTAVARYFATAAGHAYRRAVKAGIASAANAVAVGHAQPPADELSAIQFVADYIMPTNVPFIGTKNGTFTVEWENLAQRFVRLTTARYEREKKRAEPARQLAELRAALAAAGIEVDGLGAA